MVYTLSLMTDALYHTHCLTSPCPGCNSGPRLCGVVPTTLQETRNTTIAENGHIVTHQGQRIATVKYKKNSIDMNKPHPIIRNKILYSQFIQASIVRFRLVNYVIHICDSFIRIKAAEA
jgi:hypothetical protein